MANDLFRETLTRFHMPHSRHLGLASQITKNPRATKGPSRSIGQVNAEVTAFCLIEGIAEKVNPFVRQEFLVTFLFALYAINIGNFKTTEAHVGVLLEGDTHIGRVVGCTQPPPSRPRFGLIRHLWPLHTRSHNICYILLNKS